jgi:hypothetical protein
MQVRVLVFENRVAGACQAYPAAVRASREALPLQSWWSRGAVNARRGAALDERIRRSGPSSSEDRMRADDASRRTRPGARRSERTPPLLNRARVLPLLGVRVRRASPRAERRKPTLRLEPLRRCSGIDEERQRSEQRWSRSDQFARTRLTSAGARARAPSSSECGTSGHHHSSTQAGESQHLRHFLPPNERELGRLRRRAR